MEPESFPNQGDTMACTTLLVGRRATNDGSTIVARNEDGEDFSFDPKR